MAGRGWWWQTYAWSWGVVAKLYLVVGGCGWSWMVVNGRGWSHDLVMPNINTFKGWIKNVPHAQNEIRLYVKYLLNFNSLEII